MVDATARRTSSGGVWVNDTSFTGRQFSLPVSLNTENYSPGVVEFWDGQGVTSVYSEVMPVEFGPPPFDNEINAVTPVLDYHGNTEYGPYGYCFGDFSYNRTFYSARVMQDFSQTSGFHYYDSASRYIADLDRDTVIDLFWDNTPYTESDISPQSLVNLLNMGLGQAYSFRQSVQEEYREGGSASFNLLDGGIQYGGYATISNLSVVPLALLTNIPVILDHIHQTLPATP
jgi:hypothetical protein